MKLSRSWGRSPVDSYYHVKTIIRDYGTICAGPNPGMRYALVDGEVKMGTLYSVEDSNIGWNNYEAFLKFTYNKTPSLSH
jgi:hypothetical protein